MTYTYNEPVFSLENVSAGYDGNIILKDLNLTEYDLNVDNHTVGQTIAFIGRSGRGKSTLFKLITGLMKPISGNVRINKDGGSLVDVIEGDVSMVDQKYTLFRHKTVNEILKFSLRKNELSDKDKQSSLDALLKDWGLFSQKDQYPNQLSGGQKQRVAILSKMLTNKRYMVFDEPLSGIDVVIAKTVKDSIRRFKGQDDLNTLIFSTHDLNFAVEIADVIYVIGHEKPEDTHSTIIYKINLLERGLLGKEFGLEHIKIVEELTEVMINS